MPKHSTRKKMGFHGRSLHKKREPHATHYLSQQTSFWIATLSLIAFVTGNMVGQHGWYVFWSSVLGQGKDDLIVYTGMVNPVPSVPDLKKWSQYGGSSSSHSFRQAPRSVLAGLPPYRSTSRSGVYRTYTDIYTVRYMGAYNNRDEMTGSHPGVDIAMPTGTPIVSVGAGIIHDAREASGFGKFVVVRHPNVPDPKDPSKTTTLYSSYSHLSAIFVSKGAIVNKGQQIGLSGNSGFTTGPHLDFQIATADAPFYPYWPFTGADVRNAGYDFVEAVNKGLKQSNGLKYTVNPLVYIQKNSRPVAPTTVVAQAEPEVQRPAAPERVRTEPSRRTVTAQRTRTTRKPAVLRKPSNPTPARTTTNGTRDARVHQRLAQKRFGTIASTERTKQKTRQRSAPEAPRQLARSRTEPKVIVSQKTVAAATTDVRILAAETAVAGVLFQHDGSFNGRSWEKVTVILVDEEGRRIENPILKRDIQLRPAYGAADIRPQTLSALDFSRGKTTIRVQPRGRRSLVLQAYPFTDLSKPMSFTK